MKNFEKVVRECYSTWGTNYYDDFLGKNAAYPPVHAELLKRLLVEAKARRVLDAGCGPASFLRDLDGEAMDVYGFDLTPEMVAEGKRIFAAKGWDPERIWEGSVLNPAAYRPPHEARQKFDAAVCIGVLPHIPPEHDRTVIDNLQGALVRGGLVALEARNQLFSLFTMNRYSHQFFMEELLRAEELEAKAGRDKKKLREAFKKLASHFRRQMPAIRRGKQGEPGYDEVLSRTHNPLVLREQVEEAGFKDVRLLFYHWHSLPPMYGDLVPKLFRRESIAMEKNPEDWRGYFMASAFIVTGKKI